MTGPDTAKSEAGHSLRRLNKRSQFLRAARGNRAGRRAFALQAIASDELTPGVGFTVTKKVGNAPERNRIKRRLREVVKASARDFQSQHDYVLVGRREALSEPFGQMVTDLSALLIKVHADKARPNKAGGLRNSR
ncbi:ribonuclease P protein component [Paradevosia shaoguanensis]|uniref:Ribonuclease P protein component n=1 Tax=Paradevosia shaoguanensis TaxID=1335043 RepID=A0AA41QIU7_9HYPH|nr:ribonuclease P protein component [Paradevosia shaoguanensis]MCF1741134.1 ribonuclease P protein component [Paradevosia shaoguanensis]MCI0125617.1 ribonuclease P protein component [Paradevosia shaoguanensis]